MFGLFPLQEHQTADHVSDVIRSTRTNTQYRRTVLGHSHLPARKGLVRTQNGITIDSFNIIPPMLAGKGCKRKPSDYYVGYQVLRIIRTALTFGRYQTGLNHQRMEFRIPIKYRVHRVRIDRVRIPIKHGGSSSPCHP